jgi:hypothetical protein
MSKYPLRIQGEGYKYKGMKNFKRKGSEISYVGVRIERKEGRLLALKNFKVNCIGFLFIYIITTEALYSPASLSFCVNKDA